MKELPNKINTVSGTLELRQVKEVKDSDGSDLFGICLYGKDFKILIRKDMKDCLKQQTLLHELIHSIENAHGIGLKEETVDILATGISFILRNNPELVKFLSKK